MEKNIDKMLTQMDDKRQYQSLDLKNIVLQHGTLLGFIIVFGLISILSPYFATISNFISVINQMVILFIMALGASFALIEGGFDLSIGAVTGLSCVLACGLQDSGHGLVIALTVSLLIAVVIGVINSMNIVLLGVPPFIATIAMMFIVKGLELLYSRGRVIARGINDSYRFLGQGWIGPLPVLVIIFIIAIVVANTLLSSTKFGRGAYATGANKIATRLSGVNVTYYRMVLYTLAGVAGGIAGILLGARLSSAPVWGGEQLLLPAYTAAFFGSSMSQEGEFTVLGTAFGAFFIAGLNNGITLLGYGWYWQQIVLGIVLIFCVSISSLKERD
jgi:ribose transport system permease protein